METEQGKRKRNAKWVILYGAVPELLIDKAIFEQRIKWYEERNHVVICRKLLKKEETEKSKTLSWDHWGRNMLNKFKEQQNGQHDLSRWEEESRREGWVGSWNSDSEDLVAHGKAFEFYFKRMRFWRFWAEVRHGLINILCRFFGQCVEHVLHRGRRGNRQNS